MARVWTAGCISRARFLEDVRTAFHAALSMGADGQLQIQSDAKHPTLIERLARGTDVPAWLKQVPLPFDMDYQLYEVVGK